MDKVSQEQAEAIKKASTIRLQQKLLNAGETEEKVATLDRTALMNLWAEYVAGGKGEPSPTVATPQVTYDPEIERRRLDLQAQELQFKREQAERDDRIRREQAAAEEKRKREAKEEQVRQEAAEAKLRQEQAAAEERRKMEEKEEQLRKEAREDQLRKEAQEREDRARQEAIARQDQLREEENQKEERRRAEDAEAEERKRREDADERRRQEATKNRPVNKAKMYGNALRASMTMMPEDNVEVLAFFRDCEGQFDKYEVPQDLRSLLIRPYLNKRAKLLVSRMDPGTADDYQSLKSTILRELKLSPNAYYEKFQTLVKQETETFVLFMSRLRSVLDFYLESRGVEDFETLKSLLLADRLKKALNEPILRHVLTVETTVKEGWLEARALAEAVDRYIANRPLLRDRNRDTQKSAGKAGEVKAASEKSETGSGEATNSSDKPQFPGGIKRPMICWVCKQPGCRASNHKRGKDGWNRGPDGENPPMKRVSRAMVERPTLEMSMQVDQTESKLCIDENVCHIEQNVTQVGLTAVHCDSQLCVDYCPLEFTKVRI